jgi:hypothetical protein
LLVQAPLLRVELLRDVDDDADVQIAPAMAAVAGRPQCQELKVAAAGSFPGVCAGRKGPGG